jgi:hypothetical protein
MDEQVPIDVSVAHINERLDFILLKAETNVVEVNFRKFDKIVIYLL